VVVALTILGVAVVVALVATFMAFLTRPVAPAHADALRGSARALYEALALGRSSDYGVGYDPKRAFQAHYGRLGRELDRWDDVLVACTAAHRALVDHIGSAMTDHRIETPDFNANKIKEYMVGLAIRHAKGEQSQPPKFDWTGYGSATPPLMGVFTPAAHRHADWIGLPMQSHETPEAWHARGEPYMRQADNFVADTFASSHAPATAYLTAFDAVEAFRSNDLPTLISALVLVLEREPPRTARRRCATC
jgi:hypothetical protein